jgi:hypothetical protein
MANFGLSKSYCTQTGGFLVTPRTSIERNFLSAIIQNQIFWVNSFITNPSQQYKWPDGSLVGGFASNEPNNWTGNSSHLVEDALYCKDGLFNDVPNTEAAYAVCQYN